jgi:hypothetical protein
MSKLQIHAGLALVMFADGALTCGSVVEITLCTRAATAHSRGAINGKIKNLAGSGSPASLLLGDAARIAAA